MPVSGGGGSAAIKAGEAFVALRLNGDAYLRGLDNAAKRLQSFGVGVTKVGAAIGGIGGAILAPIAAAFTGAVSRANDFGLLAEQTGASVESLSRLAYAFSTAGLKQEDFVDVTKTLQQQLAAAADGQDEIFRRLGLNARQLISLPLDQQLQTVAQALNEVANPADKAAVALRLLGGQGQKALRVLGDPRALQGLMAEAGDVGAVITKDMADSAREIQRSFDTATSAVKYAFLEIGNALLPQKATIARFATQVIDVAKAARRFLTENKSLVLTVTAVAGGLIAAGAAIAAFGAVFTAVGTGIAAFVIAVKAVAAAVLALFTPMGAILAAAGALAYFFRDKLAAAFGGVRDVAVEAWGGIASALKRGDLAAAGEIALAGLRVVALRAWANLVTWWADASKPLIRPLVSLRQFAAEVWATVSEVGAAALSLWREAAEMVAVNWDSIRPVLRAVFAPLVIAWEAASALLAGGVDGLTGYFRETWESLASGVRGVVDGVTGYLITAWESLPEAIRAPFEAVVATVSSVLTPIVDVVTGLFTRTKDAITSTWESLPESLTSTLETLTGVVAVVLAPIPTLVAGIFTSAGDEVSAVWDRVTGVFTGFLEWFDEAFPGVSDTIRGVMDSAMEVFREDWETVRGIFAGAVEVMSDVWGSFKALLTGDFTEATIMIRKAWTDVTAFIQKSFTDVIANMLGKAAKIAKFIGADQLADKFAGWADAAKMAGEDIVKDRDRVNAGRREKLEVGAKAAEDANRQVAEKAGGALEAAEDAFRELLNREVIRAQEDAKQQAKPDAPEIKIPKLLAEAPKAVRGIFQASDFRQVFAVGDSVAQRQLRVAQEGNGKLDEIKGKLDNLGVAFN